MSSEYNIESAYIPPSIIPGNALINDPQNMHMPTQVLADIPLPSKNAEFTLGKVVVPGDQRIALAGISEYVDPAVRKRVWQGATVPREGIDDLTGVILYGQVAASAEKLGAQLAEVGDDSTEIPAATYSAGLDILREQLAHAVAEERILKAPALPVQVASTVPQGDFERLDIDERYIVGEDTLGAVSLVKAVKDLHHTHTRAITTAARWVVRRPVSG